MRRGVAIGATAVGLLLAAFVAVPAYAAEDPAASMYEPSTISVIHLTLSQSAEEELEAEPDEYVEGTFSLAETDGTPGGVGAFSTPITVGIRLKGQLGSGRTLAQKAAFKLKLNYVKGTKFRGLKKMTLNNMVQDESQVHETDAYTLFRALGVPAPRTGYAYVYLNEVDYGMHLNIETPDDVALEKRFGPFKHLYEGDYGTDVEPGSAGLFEVDEGDEEDISDLEELIDVVNESGGDWSQRVETVADLKEMTRMWAVEKYIGHWDGYSGQEGGYWPNNYYLVDPDPGRFLMLPWGTDQTFQEEIPFSGDAGVLFDDCLADSSCFEMYRRSLRELLAALPAVGLQALSDATAARLKPWIELEQGNSRHEHSVAEFEDELGTLREFLEDRPEQLQAFLTGQPPEVPAAHVGLALAPTRLLPDGTATATATVTVTDAEGNPLPGDPVKLVSSDPGETIGPVHDNDDGTFTATITASSAPGTATVTASDGSVSETATLLQGGGPAAHVALALDPATLLADGAATTTATATVTDEAGVPVVGDSLHFNSTDPDETIGPVHDNDDGTYSATITASQAVGTATITASDAAVEPALSGEATLTQTAVAPDKSGSNTGGGAGNGAGSGGGGAVPVPFALTGVRRAGERLKLEADAPGSGSLSVVGSFGDGKRRACGGTMAIGAAGGASLTCGFTKAFRRALGADARRVRLEVVFTPASGAAAADLRRSVRVAGG